MPPLSLALSRRATCPSARNESQVASVPASSRADQNVTGLALHCRACMHALLRTAPLRLRIISKMNLRCTPRTRWCTTPVHLCRLSPCSASQQCNVRACARLHTVLVDGLAQQEAAVHGGDQVGAEALRAAKAAERCEVGAHVGDDDCHVCVRAGLRVPAGFFNH